MSFYPSEHCCLYIIIQKIALQAESETCLQIWFFPRFGGKKWWNSEHAHASYPELFFRPPGFSPYMGREKKNFRDWTTLAGVTKRKLTNHSAGHEQWIQTEVVWANHERAMAIVRNRKLPLPKTNLLYCCSWTPWTATEELIAIFLVIKMAVNRKGGLYVHGTKFMNLFRYI